MPQRNARFAKCNGAKHVENGDTPADEAAEYASDERDGSEGLHVVISDVARIAPWLVESGRLFHHVDDAEVEAGDGGAAVVEREAVELKGVDRGVGVAEVDLLDPLLGPLADAVEILTNAGDDFLWSVKNARGQFVEPGADGKVVGGMMQRCARFVVPPFVAPQT